MFAELIKLYIMHGKRLTQQEYIRKCKKVNPEYDYSELGFTTISGQFVTPICKKHGKFRINARGLMTKHINCPECEREKRFKEFIEKARKIHGDKYKYDLSTYKNNKIPVKITCVIHGDFWQAPGDHLKGYGCSKCSGKYKPSTEEWIERAASIYNYKYDYSKVKYIDNKTPVTVICPEHGEFYPIPSNHIKGTSGCPKCKGIKIGERCRSNTIEFIEKSKLIHGNRYDYSKVEYIKKDIPVTIICPIHGEFNQLPSIHLKGSGCQACNFKNQGILYSKIKDYFPNIKFEQEYTSDWLGKQRLDIYCLEYNFGIEYDGEQHYQSIDYFGGDQYFKVLQERDLLKNQKCLKNKCKLFRVKYSYTEDDLIELINNIRNYISDSSNFIPQLREGSKITII